MTHFRNTSADEERLHTFVMDYCFPYQGSWQGISASRQGNSNKGPSEEPNGYMVKVVTDFWSACGCGRVNWKSDGES